MSEKMQLPAGRYHYEEVAVGNWFETGRLVVTESHIVQFAGLSGDFFDVHMDDQFAIDDGFEGRVAHGLLGLILTDGLKNRAKTQLAAIASLGWNNWAFRKPIYIGTSIQARVEIVSKRLTSKGDRGIVGLGFSLRDAAGEVLQEGDNLLLMRV
ncbi:MaoC/PaaZ C-terminal domain-containing protein [Roseibium sp. M-1]